MKTTHHFTRTDAINEAKRIYSMGFKDKVKLEHNGAFWVLSDR